MTGVLRRWDASTVVRRSRLSDLWTLWTDFSANEKLLRTREPSLKVPMPELLKFGDDMKTVAPAQKVNVDVLRVDHKSATYFCQKLFLLQLSLRAQ